MKVEQVMKRDVLVLAPGESLREAARTFLEHGIAGAPVVEDGRVVGVLSGTDIVEVEEGTNGAHTKAGARTVRDAMTSPAVTVEPWVGLWAAAQTMAESGVHRLPVVDREGALLGLVSCSDLVAAFVRPDEDIAREIREEIVPEFERVADGIHVDVVDGEVTLSGDVTPFVADALPRAVRRVAGVVDVHAKFGAQAGRW